MSKIATELTRLADIADHYDGVLSDVWGVVHNAITPHALAVTALADFRRQGGRVVLITNAARTRAAVQKMLDKMGISRDVYDAIVTSGDVTRALIEPYDGQAIHHVGPATDHPIFAGLDLKKVPAEAAVAVVVTGLDNPGQTPTDYQQRLENWRDLNLPMICANPDKVVEVGDKIVYCAGALADIYADMGGQVALAGKPYAPIYDTSMAAMDAAAGKPVAREKVLAIGDSVRTDATGAAVAGMDFLFITGSIHAAEIKAAGADHARFVQELVKPSGAKLVGFQEKLA